MPSVWTTTLNRYTTTLLCLLLLGGFFFQHSLFSEDFASADVIQSPVQQELSSIPIHDRITLEKFFQIFVTADGLGYTLFGNKPICLTAYFAPVPLGNRLRGCYSDSIKRGWETWQKYEKHFPHPRYLIFEESEKIDDTVVHTIYVLDKIKVITTINQHHVLFQKELGRRMDAENILSSIEQSHTLAILNHHEGLLGILLGYGEESAMKYHQRNLVWESGLPLSYEEGDLQPTTALLPHFIYPTIQPIHFVGNLKSPEVISILKQNLKEREYLLETYSKGNFLEITLAQLMQANF